MKILDLFAGLGGEQRRENVEQMGHEYITSDLLPRFGCTVTGDILSDETVKKIEELGPFDMVWASPPCEAFSVASIGKNWDKDTKQPKTESARLGIEILKQTIFLINHLQPKRFYIENPRGMMRVHPVMAGFHRATVSYCQYSLSIMKPTDIFTNDLKWSATARCCKNGDPCHERAPRGARTGTQGIKGSAERAVVPWQLWYEILKSQEE